MWKIKTHPCERMELSRFVRAIDVISYNCAVVTIGLTFVEHRKAQQRASACNRHRFVFDHRCKRETCETSKMSVVDARYVESHRARLRYLKQRVFAIRRYCIARISICEINSAACDVKLSSAHVAELIYAPASSSLS